MDKYTELLKDIATLIADTNRENFLLKCDLEKTKNQLNAAEAKISAREAELECANERISDLVAVKAVALLAEEGAADA